MAKCIHIWWNEHSRKMGWVIMKSKCAKVNEETNVYEHSNESIEVKTYLVLMMRGEII